MTLALMPVSAARFKRAAHHGLAWLTISAEKPFGRAKEQIDLVRRPLF